MIPPLTSNWKAWLEELDPMKTITCRTGLRETDGMGWKTELDAQTTVLLSTHPRRSQILEEVFGSDCITAMSTNPRFGGLRLRVFHRKPWDLEDAAGVESYVFRRGAGDKVTTEFTVAVEANGRRVFRGWTTENDVLASLARPAELVSWNGKDAHSPTGSGSPRPTQADYKWLLEHAEDIYRGCDAGDVHTHMKHLRLCEIAGRIAAIALAPTPPSQADAGLRERHDADLTERQRAFVEAAGLDWQDYQDADWHDMVDAVREAREEAEAEMQAALSAAPSPAPAVGPDDRDGMASSDPAGGDVHAECQTRAPGKPGGPGRASVPGHSTTAMEPAPASAGDGKLSHAVWHALDDCEERADGSVVVTAEHYQRLCELVPEEHPEPAPAIARPPRPQPPENLSVKESEMLP